GGRRVVELRGICYLKCGLRAPLEPFHGVWDAPGRARCQEASTHLHGTACGRRTHRGGAGDARISALQRDVWREYSPSSRLPPSRFQTSVMGVKMLQCFPFYRRSKERCKSRQCPPEAVPTEETKPRLSSTTSWGSDSDGAGSRGSQVYFSTKARLSFRHQLDSNINAVDATY
ncbi:uncharacterized protein si:ch211-237l4.6, partial [Betta splendens]|uniref:Uncharacterized protein si:ch211-237l4.6 n=1 Tax=Betta splendens TaxID=158456 RepID=A0A8M1HAM2_BETSP